MRMKTNKVDVSTQEMVEMIQEWNEKTSQDSSCAAGLDNNSSY